MLNAKRIFMPLVVLAVAAGTAAPAATIAFSGSGTSGTINPDSLLWTLVPDDSTVCCTPTPPNPAARDISVWGIPELGSSDEFWPSGVGDAVSFSITFTGLPGGVTIDQTADPAPTGFDDYTRFHNGDDTIIWTPSYSDGDTVTFTASTPSEYLSAGTPFYVNIAFTGGTVDTVDFTGDWTTAEVPEPGSLSLAVLAFLGMAAFARRRILR